MRNIKCLGKVFKFLLENFRVRRACFYFIMSFTFPFSFRKHYLSNSGDNRFHGWNDITRFSYNNCTYLCNLILYNEESVMTSKILNA